MNIQETQPLLSESNISPINDTPKKKCSKKCHRCCKYTCITFGIISFLFLIISLISYLVLINFQTHISYTKNNNTKDITVTWGSIFDYNHKYVELYSPQQTKLKLEGISRKYYTYKLFPSYSHKVDFKNLAYDTKYNYKINMGPYESKTFSFKTPIENKTDLNIIVFGDMGTINAQSRNFIIKDAKSGNFDFIFHLGDISYNLETFWGIMGSIYLTQIQDAASTIPYMTIPGNHEYYNNFTQYINRFNMPDYKIRKNLYYSLNFPPLKMINLNTEALYFSSLENTKQYMIEFVNNEIKHINRTLYPWVIVTGHRPMYCSNKNSDDCTSWMRDKVRTQFEKLFVDNNITIYLSAHEHTYERICPIYSGVCQDNLSNNFYNYSKLKYPINIISGTAGCIEGHVKFINPPHWSLVRSRNSGYGNMYVNKTHLIWKEYAIIDNKKELIDHFIIVK